MPTHQSSGPFRAAREPSLPTRRANLRPRQRLPLSGPHVRAGCFGGFMAEVPLIPQRIFTTLVFVAIGTEKLDVRRIIRAALPLWDDVVAVQGDSVATAASTNRPRLELVGGDPLDHAGSQTTVWSPMPSRLAL